MKKIVFNCVRCICCILLLASCGGSQKSKEITLKDYLVETKEDRDIRMAWWREARFGMFIHWGLYAVAAGEYEGKEIDGYGEWIMDLADIPIEAYEKYAPQFNPVQYNAARWVSIAKNAGMKYIVITSKHHDGFALWDSEVSKYDIMDATPYKKDILQALSDECKKQGIVLCFYHSIMDWYHPDANPRDSKETLAERMKKFPEYRDGYMKVQLKELLSKYDAGVLWFDGEWIDEWTEAQGKELYNYLRNIKPDLIINNRVGKARYHKEGDAINYCGDFGTPEQEILEGTSDSDWESCITMNDTWGFKKKDVNWKPAKKMIHDLIDIAAKGGNFLLNVGPTAEGLIPETSVERLAEMGEWMKINGKAIYATHALKQFKDGDHIRFTQSKDNKYINVFSYVWPGDRLTTHQVVPKEGTEIILLGYDKPLKWAYSEKEGLIINLTEEVKSSFTGPKAYAYTFQIEGTAL